MPKSKKARMEQQKLIPDEVSTTLPHSNAQRYKPLLREIYDKFSQGATLANAMLNHAMSEEEMVTIASQIADIAERGKFNCDELETVAKNLPSQAGQ